jgi:predicted DNA-binding transcriptional regulator AlpA
MNATSSHPNAALADADTLALPTPTVSTPATDPILIDWKRFAELLDVSRATFDRMKAAGKLPRHIELSRGCHRWRLSVVRAWIEGGCPPIKEWEARNANGRR